MNFLYCNVSKNQMKSNSSILSQIQIFKEKTYRAWKVIKVLIMTQGGCNVYPQAKEWTSSIVYHSQN